MGPRDPTHTSQTLHLSHIWFTSFLHFHTPGFRPIHYCRHYNSLIQLSFQIHRQTPTIPHFLHCTKGFHSLTHSHTNILFHSSVAAEIASQILERVYHFHSFSVQHYVQHSIVLLFHILFIAPKVFIPSPTLILTSSFTPPSLLKKLPRYLKEFTTSILSPH